MSKSFLWISLLVLSASACTIFFEGRPVRDTSRVGNLGIELTTNRSLVNAGQPIEFRLTVTNHGTSEEVIELSNRPILDIVVSISTARELLRFHWSDGREITPEMKRLALAPGGSRTLEWTWVAVEEAKFAVISVTGWVNDGRSHGGAESATVDICVERCFYS